MADIVDPITRSRMMAGIRSGNTKPELTIRKGLHRLGLRYRLHSNSAAGKPDLIFARHKAAVFIHGCFWHGHDCRFFRMPATRPEFWTKKIAANQRRDAVVSAMLAQDGWRQLTVWECAIRGRKPEEVEGVIRAAAKWIKSRSARRELRGN